MGDGSVHRTVARAAHPSAGELQHDEHLSLYDERVPHVGAPAAEAVDTGAPAEDTSRRALQRQASSRRRRAALVEGLDKQLSGSTHNHSKRQHQDAMAPTPCPPAERPPSSAPFEVPQAAAHSQQQLQQQGSAPGAAAAPKSAPPQRRHRRTRSLPPCPRSPFADPDVQCQVRRLWIHPLGSRAWCACPPPRSPALVPLSSHLTPAQVVVPEPVRASQRAALSSFHAATKAATKAAPQAAAAPPAAAHASPILVLQDQPHAHTHARASFPGTSLFRKLRPGDAAHHHASGHQRPTPPAAAHTPLPSKAGGTPTASTTSHNRSWATQPRGAGGAALVEQMSAFTAAVQARLWQQQLEEEAADLTHALLTPRRAHPPAKTPRNSPGKAATATVPKGDAKLKATGVLVASAAGWRTAAGAPVVPSSAAAAAGVKWSPSSDEDLSKGLSNDQGSQAGGVSWWRALLRCGCPAPRT